MKLPLRIRVLVAASFAFVPCRIVNAAPPTEREQVRAALNILEPWQADQPKADDRSLHLVCWTPSDRQFPVDYKARLTRIMGHIQQFYLREMERHGFKGSTFNLNLDANDQLILHTAVGQHATEHYAVQSGSEIRKDCVPVLKKAGIDPERQTILILCNLATWDEKNLRFTHKSPYYAGGSFRSGTAWQLDSPELDSRNLKLTKPMMRDGQYGRISLGKHNSIFIGGVAHELGHALGLPHCKARSDEMQYGTALMGSGNRTYGDELRGEGRGSFLTLAHALRLASHPQFSGSKKGLNQRATAAIDDLSIKTADKSIQVSGVVKGDPPVYAMVAYFDPDGGGDYNSTTATAVPDSDGRFMLNSGELPRGKAGELRLFPLHANGSAAGQMSRTQHRYAYTVGKDGTPNLDAFQTRQELSPIVAAIANRNRPKAEKLAGKLSSERAKAVARRLLHPVKPTTTPANDKRNEKSIALTEFRSKSATVGWGRPAFDRVPDSTMLLESGGQIFETGIYAHAPARHIYVLGGKWKSLTGKAGLATGHRGTVRFQIKADGKSVWKSKTVKSGAVVDFDVSMDGVKEIELLTDPTEDGSGSDWGFWMEPTLVR